jgi:N-methylhydantoinase A
LLPDRARAALQRDVGAALGLDAMTAAFGVSEMVEEAMANAARVHAVERGKDLAGRTLIAFGGGAPLHAARLAEKLGIDAVLIPRGAGVGSAIGFLRAPVAFEVVRSRFMRVSGFNAGLVNDLFAEMETEAVGAVRLGAPDAKVMQIRTAEMRYAGQGHEIVVPLPVRQFAADDAQMFRDAFEAWYNSLFGRIIPNLDMEVVSWTLRATAMANEEPAVAASTVAAFAPAPSGMRPVYDRALGMLSDVPVYRRTDLTPGARIAGPAVITEDATTTIVGPAFVASIDTDGAIRLRREITG